MVKNLPAMQETWVWSLGWEDPLEKEMVTQSSIKWLRSLVGYSPWECKELDTTERLMHTHTPTHCQKTFTCLVRSRKVTSHSLFFKSCKREYQFSSVQFSCSVMSNSLRPYGLQHARLCCPSPTPGVYSNSDPNQWCHPIISSSVVPFSSCLQSFPAAGSFQMSQFFASGGQSIGVSASASVFPMNI